MSGRRRSRIPKLAAAIVLTAAFSLVSLAANEPLRVSQKERAFAPGEVAIRRGDALRLVNDDYDLLHHAYIESDTFSFDSGDQQPGSKTDIRFPVSGDFKILCGIHPKMKLVVHVR